jgi:hypothetical protein
MGLIIVSFVLNAAPVLVNWHLASTMFPQATDPYALLPRQHMAVWNGLYLATQGQPLPAPADIANDPIRSAGARFPDLWTIRLMERSALGFFAGLGTSLVLLAVSLTCFIKLLTKRGSNKSEQA